MKAVILSSSPNTDGLTAACAEAVAQGISQAGCQAIQVRLNDLDVGMCQACDNGWGTCREEGRCCLEDDFATVQRQFREADACVLVTPVYFGEPSESMKAFLDRFRRCERGGEYIVQKPVLAIAAAGGSGNGTVSCLAILERWIQHVRARKTDFIGVTRFTRRYKIGQIKEAGEALIRDFVQSQR